MKRADWTSLEFIKVTYAIVLVKMAGETPVKQNNQKAYIRKQLVTGACTGVSFFWLCPWPRPVTEWLSSMDSNPALFQHCRYVSATSRQGGPHMVEVYGRFKMGYINGVHDSKAWPQITHFKATWESSLPKGIVKKKTPLCRLTRPLAKCSGQARLRHFHSGLPGIAAFSVPAFLWCAPFTP